MELRSGGSQSMDGVELGVTLFDMYLATRAPPPASHATGTPLNNSEPGPTRKLKLIKREGLFIPALLDDSGNGQTYSCRVHGVMP